MSRYSTLKLDNPTSIETTKPTSRRSKTLKTSIVTKRCEVCGIYHSISDLVVRDYDPLTKRAIVVCKFCTKSTSQSTVIRYSYKIEETPVDWLTGSHTKRVAK